MVESTPNSCKECDRTVWIRGPVNAVKQTHLADSKKSQPPTDAIIIPLREMRTKLSTITFKNFEPQHALNTFVDPRSQTCGACIKAINTILSNIRGENPRQRSETPMHYALEELRNEFPNAGNLFTPGE